MWTFKFQSNLDPCNANIQRVHTLHPGTGTFQKGIMTHCKGRVCLFCFRYWSWHLNGIMSGKQGYFPSPCIFFWIDVLAWNVVQSPDIFWGSVHMGKNRRSVSCVPTVWYCYSCRDPPFFATSLNSYFLSSNHSRAGQQMMHPSPLSFLQV